MSIVSDPGQVTLTAKWTNVLSIGLDLSPLSLSSFHEFVLIVCFGFTSPSRIFTHMETSPQSMKGCKYLIYAPLQRPLSS